MAWIACLNFFRLSLKLRDSPPQYLVETSKSQRATVRHEKAAEMTSEGSALFHKTSACLSDGERRMFLLKLSPALESTTGVSHHHPLLKNPLGQELGAGVWSTPEGAAPQREAKQYFSSGSASSGS